MTRILVLEDSELQAHNLASILRSAKYEVAVAHNGQEGFRLLRSSSFDLVLSDVMMPGISGYEVCRQLKADDELKEIPVVLITQLSEPWDIIEGLECGANGFITKPFETIHLLTTVENVLTNRALQDKSKLSSDMQMRLMGRTVHIRSDREQILGVLLSTIDQFIRAQHRESEARRVQAVLLESQRSLQATLDALSANIVVLNSSGGIVALNAACRRENVIASIFGMSGDVGTNYLEMCEAVQGEHRQTILDLAKNISHLIAEKTQPFELEVCCSRKDQRWFHISVTRVQETAAIVIAHADISARKQAEESFRKSQTQLQRASKLEAIGRLAGGLAHDFNNILCIILGYSQNLCSELLPGTSSLYAAQAIHTAGARAATLTKQLLLVGREKVATPQAIDVNEALRQSETILRYLLGPQIELQFIPAPNPAFIRADMGQIEQVLLNLALNAGDAMPDGGTVSIRVERASEPRGAVMLSVADTGCGMDDDVKEHLFEPFFTTKEPGKGTGLGLATVFGIVQQCGGRIEVQSEPHAGSTFQLYFPAVDNPRLPAFESTAELQSNAPCVLRN